MAEAFASIMAMYQWDPTLFDGMSLPAGVDKDLLTDNLMMELAELGLVYPDPEFMKYAIEKWSAKEIEKWTELYETTQLDYNAIENYNRVETGTDTNVQTHDTTDTETRNLSGSNDETRNLTGSIADSGDDVDTKAVNAYNGGPDIESEKNTTTHGLTRNSADNGTVERELTDTGTVEDKKEGTVTDARTVNMTTKGNIGVTTTQQMIQQERDILEFNIYDYITDAFKSRFCIMVW